MCSECSTAVRGGGDLTLLYCGENSARYQKSERMLYIVGDESLTDAHGRLSLYGRVSAAYALAAKRVELVMSGSDHVSRDRTLSTLP